MQCPRCAGMRVSEVITEGGIRALALRCLLCGDVVDRVIVRNRQRSQHIRPSRDRTPVYGNRKWDRLRSWMEFYPVYPD
jgi:uncharacterized Zn finger protein